MGVYSFAGVSMVPAILPAVSTVLFDYLSSRSGIRLSGEDSTRSATRLVVLV